MCLNEKLIKCGQKHILDHISAIEDADKQILLSQLNNIDWDEMDSLIKKYVIGKEHFHAPSDIKAPHYFSFLPGNEKDKKYYDKAVQEGKSLISKGKVAILTVAGGQGSRLGFEGPKGKYPITPVKNKTLFQYNAEKIRRISNKYSTTINWFIMTSPANDSETREYFDLNNNFNIGKNNIHFFSQGTMPAIALDGKLLLGARNSLALSPNGHGGALLALNKSGMLSRMESLGIEHISYFQIDNPLVSIASPLFIGLHKLENSEMSSRALIKTDPFEKLGNFCIVDGKLQIIEYSDMPNELAEKKDEQGRLVFRVGSPAIHIFKVDFIKRLTRHRQLQLPWHKAVKKVSFIDSEGKLVKPVEPNAVKLETFIFDALPFAENPLILEGLREEEFSPVKNPDGVDSAASCRKMMIEKDSKKLEFAKIKVPKTKNGAVDCVIELSPLTILDNDDALDYFKNRNIRLQRAKEYYFE